jgi:hypothetical protein
VIATSSDIPLYDQLVRTLSLADPAVLGDSALAVGAFDQFVAFPAGEWEGNELPVLNQSSCWKFLVESNHGLQYKPSNQLFRLGSGGMLRHR